AQTPAPARAGAGLNGPAPNANMPASAKRDRLGQRRDQAKVTRAGPGDPSLAANSQPSVTTTPSATVGPFGKARNLAKVRAARRGPHDLARSGNTPANAMP